MYNERAQVHLGAKDSSIKVGIARVKVSNNAKSSWCSTFDILSEEEDESIVPHVSYQVPQMQIDYGTSARVVV